MADTAKCSHCGAALPIEDTIDGEEGDLLAKAKPLVLRALLRIAQQMLEEEDLVGAVHAVIAAAGMAKVEMTALALHECFPDA